MKQDERLEKMSQLFSEGRQFEPEHKIAVVRGYERRIAALAAQVAADAPNTQEHAEALLTHEYMLLSLARTTRRKDMQRKFIVSAREKGMQAVDILLAVAKTDRGTAFSAYNLAIDLICAKEGPGPNYELGLKYMVEAKRALRHTPKKHRPSDMMFWIDYGIAKAHHGLGHRDEAEKVLKRALRGVRLNDQIKNFAGLRGIAKCSELLADIILDKRS